MTSGQIITFIGFTLIFFYVLIQIFNFYGIGTNVYAIYFVFYLFILLSLLVLPR